MNPESIADAYFSAIRAKDVDAFVALFAEDADYIMPNGTSYHGTAQIRDIQSHVFASGSPVPTPVSIMADDTGMAVEVEARLPDGSIRNTVNLYRFNDIGLIQRLSVYIKTG